MEAKLLDRVYWAYDDEEQYSGFVVGKITGLADVKLEFVDLFTRSESLVPATIYLVTVEERVVRSTNRSLRGQQPCKVEEGSDMSSALCNQLRHVGEAFQQRFFRTTNGLAIACEGMKTIKPEIISKVEEVMIEEFYTSKVPLTVFLGRYKSMMMALKELEEHLDAPDFVQHIERNLAIFPNKIASIMAIVNSIPGNKEKMQAVYRAIELLY